MLRGRGRGRGFRGGYNKNKVEVADLLRSTNAAIRKQIAQQNQISTRLEDEEEIHFHANPRVQAMMDVFRELKFLNEHKAKYRTADLHLARFLSEALLAGPGVERPPVAYFSSFVGSTNGQHIRLPIVSDAIISQEDPSFSSGAVLLKKKLPNVQEIRFLRSLMYSVQNRNSASADQKRKTCSSDNVFSSVTVSIDQSTYTLTQYTEGWEIVNDSSKLKRIPLSNFLLYRSGWIVHLSFDSEVLEREAEVPDTVELVSKTSMERKIITITEPDGLIEWQLSIVSPLAEDANTNDDEDQGQETLQIGFSFSDRFWSRLKQLYEVVGNQPSFQNAVKSLSVLWLQNAKLLLGFDLAAEDARDSSIPFFYPSLIGDSVADVRRHYNLKKIGLARESAIEIVRRMNNQAKRILIEEFAANRSSVLDLACGHGQDLLKYGTKHLKLYVGVDISSEEIKEARQRARQRRHGVGSEEKPPEQCRFHVGNMLAPETYKKFLQENARVFDSVSVQLAIHYTLNSDEDADLILASISERLKPGGIFVGSLPSSFVIAERMKNQLRREVLDESTLRYSFGNDVYSVYFESETFEEIRGCEDTEVEGVELTKIAELPIGLPGDADMPPHPWVYAKQAERHPPVPMGFGKNDISTHHLIDSNPLLFELSERWGLKYTFWLVDHIDASENIVPWRAFCRLAKKHNLTCILTAPFDQYIEQMRSRGNESTIDFMRRVQPLIDENPTAQFQAEVISFYQVFAFQKDVLPSDPPDSLALIPPALRSS